MFFTYFIYVLLLIIFVAVTALILRFTVKFGYLSPRFKYAVGGFLILSIILIGFSLYLLANTSSSGSSGGTTQQQGGLNF